MSTNPQDFEDDRQMVLSKPGDEPSRGNSAEVERLATIQSPSGRTRTHSGAEGGGDMVRVRSWKVLTDEKFGLSHRALGAFMVSSAQK